MDRENSFTPRPRGSELSSWDRPSRSFKGRLNATRANVAPGCSPRPRSSRSTASSDSPMTSHYGDPGGIVKLDPTGVEGAGRGFPPRSPSGQVDPRATRMLRSGPANSEAILRSGDLSSHSLRASNSTEGGSRPGSIVEGTIVNLVCQTLAHCEAPGSRASFLLSGPCRRQTGLAHRAESGPTWLAERAQLPPSPPLEAAR